MAVSDALGAPRYRGKVRDLYAVGEDQLLMIASDRLSAFDVVMAEPVPGKGRVLTGITDYWVRRFADVPAALVSCDPAVIERAVPALAGEAGWAGRAMLVRRAEMLPIECIVRGRLAGGAYEEYRQHGTVHGDPAPTGMELTDPFPEPIFTPSTKAESGHDQNLSRAEARARVGDATYEAAAAVCLRLFTQAAADLASRGLVLADTKFELGVLEGELVLCDEVVTPDSSRLWPAGEVRRGEVPPSFDKQPFRDWLDAAGWDRQPPPPPVPAQVIASTQERYERAYELVTGSPLGDWYGA